MKAPEPPFSSSLALREAEGVEPEGTPVGEPLDAAQLRGLRSAVGQLLAELAAQVEGGLPPALERAQRAWDQADEVDLLPPAVRQRMQELRSLLQATGAHPSPAMRAVSREGLLILEAASGLVQLVERRLSAIIRLRSRAPQADLWGSGGRPFLDLGAALQEAARCWR